MSYFLPSKVVSSPFRDKNLRCFFFFVCEDRLTQLFYNELYFSWVFKQHLYLSFIVYQVIG